MLKIKVMVQGIGVFNLCQIPHVGEFFKVGGNIFPVAKVVHFCEPENDVAALIELSYLQIDTHPKIDKSHFESAKAARLDGGASLASKQRCIKHLQKSLGIKEPSISKAEFRGDRWMFEFKSNSTEIERYEVMTGDLRVHKV